MASQNNTIYDELLECLNDRLFQIPVKSFMDENCLIFDPSIEISPDHRAVFTSYQELVGCVNTNYTDRDNKIDLVIDLLSEFIILLLKVTDLLKDFCQSKRVSFGQLNNGVLKLYAEPDLREVFGENLEQVLAATDFDVFNHLMIKHNIVIQEQVLQMILASTGIVPDSLLNTKTLRSEDAKQAQTQDTIKTASSQPKLADKKNMKGKGNDIDSKKEREIEEHRKQIEEEMRLLALESTSAAKATKLSPELTTTAKSTSKTSIVNAKSQTVTSSSRMTSSQMTSTEAAQKWISEALEESGNCPDEGSATRDGWKLEASDMKQRQQFLREQRDKILAMRREARDKQLGIGPEPRTTTKASNDATRNVQQPSTPTASESAENEKMLAKRRALAAKLRQEVVDKQ